METDSTIPQTIQDFGKPLQQGMLSHGFRLGSHRLDQLVVMIQIDQIKKALGHQNTFVRVM